MSKEKNTTKKTVNKRRFDGVVVNNAADKTAKVLVNVTKTHPKYRIQYTVGKKYPVHDEKNELKIGDRVIFEECRPLSKTKRWRLISIEK